MKKANRYKSDIYGDLQSDCKSRITNVKNLY